MSAEEPVNFPELTARYLDAQLDGDRRSALRLLLEQGLERGATPLELYDHVVRVAQRRIGELWLVNEITIAEEHQATGISHMVLAHLYERCPNQPPNGRTVAVACVAGEAHELPARMVADYLEWGGFRVRFYGASVPTHDLVRELQALAPDVLALSATMSFHAQALRETVTAIRRGCEGPLPIVIGGGVLEWSPGLIVELGVETAPTDPIGLVEAVKRIAGCPSD